MVKKILVTGASGMLGRALVSRLLSEGYSVVAGVYLGTASVFDNICSTFLSIKEFDINSCEWDLLLDGVTDVIHLAAMVHVHKRSEQDWDKFYQTNVVASEELCRALLTNNVKRFVFISTVGIYGDYPVTDENGELKINPVNMYSKSKLLAEEAVKRILDEKVPWLILRPVMIYGPGDRGNMGRMINAIKANKFLIPGSGKNKKNAIFVEDLVEIIYKLLECNDYSNQGFIVSNQNVLTVDEMCAGICQKLGKKNKVPHVPEVMLKWAGRVADLFPWVPFSSDTIKKLTVDSDFSAFSTIQSLLGIEKETSFTEALEKIGINS
ncbi:MAG: NAD-dependent epimerase/dehydratase family protein [Dehalococcoidales bacterium]|jgi:nucleoside-diphosphate-sugar epimerase|nr:NAD-dependent epimerase/dehydratase family protein [Dehalococcoidales bacterium]